MRNKKRKTEIMQRSENPGRKEDLEYQWLTEERFSARLPGERSGIEKGTKSKLIMRPRYSELQKKMGCGPRSARRGAGRLP